jgi:hypothetical protein
VLKIFGMILKLPTSLKMLFNVCRGNSLPIKEVEGISGLYGDENQTAEVLRAARLKTFDTYLTFYRNMISKKTLDEVQSLHEKLDPHFLTLVIGEAKNITKEEYIRGGEVVKEVQKSIQSFFNSQHNILLTPTIAKTACDVGVLRPSRHTTPFAINPFTFPFNWSGSTSWCDWRGITCWFANYSPK